MRKRNKRYHCGRKVGYQSSHNAQNDLDRLAERRNDSGLIVYHHGRCKGYHVGHKEKDRRINS
ncbi:MAG: hypothetical protein AB1757_21375 [Acidobacteriota bacterium]